MKTAYIFDLDDTYFKAKRFKNDLADKVVETIPKLTQEDYDKAYEGYKKEHGGRVDMTALFNQLAKSAGLKLTYQEFLPLFLAELEAREYLFDPGHEFITELGLENVYFLSQADKFHQEEKIKWIQLPGELLALPDHIKLVEEKTIDVHKQFIEDLFIRRFDRVVIINDNPHELVDVYRVHPDDVLFIELQYGDHAKPEEVERARQLIPNLIVVDSFKDLREILLVPHGIEKLGPGGERDVS